ncbi:hypothetical protein V3851_16575 [Paenibacillus sp. M1]|uniref:Uncharacterized protein n=1 Tax=Paenibacillus haidiansis TaxID=1574488 RepID=A0ABU7VVZ4_9BACL
MAFTTVHDLLIVVSAWAIQQAFIGVESWEIGGAGVAGILISIAAFIFFIKSATDRSPVLLVDEEGIVRGDR